MKFLYFHMNLDLRTCALNRPATTRLFEPRSTALAAGASALTTSKTC